MVQYRKKLLVNGEYYHIFTRSIAKYVIFNNIQQYSRLYNTMDLYRFSNFIHKYSNFNTLKPPIQSDIVKKLYLENNVLIEIVAYCIMPTHIHLLLKQIKDDGIIKYMSKILNSYSRYFNTKHNRVGPLWAGRFKSVHVQDDEQILHLTRYIHLNPTSAKLVNKPENWEYSSYMEYINESNNKICKYKDVINLSSDQYKKFVNDRKNYQRKISQIKYLLIDNYAG